MQQKPFSVLVRSISVYETEVLSHFSQLEVRVCRVKFPVLGGLGGWVGEVGGVWYIRIYYCKVCMAWHV